MHRWEVTHVSKQKGEWESVDRQELSNRGPELGATQARQASKVRSTFLVLRISSHYCALARALQSTEDTAAHAHANVSMR